MRHLLYIAFLGLLLPTQGWGAVPLPADYVAEEIGGTRLEAPKKFMDWVKPYGEVIESFRRQTESFLGHPIEGSYTFRITEDRKRFVESQPKGWGAPEWAAGLAYPHFRYTVINLQAVGQPRQAQLTLTLKHEAIHLWLGVLFDERGRGRAIPRWFEEAIAMRLADDWSLERSAALVEYLVFHDAVALVEIDKGFHDDFNASPAYLMSQQFLDHILQSYGAEKFQAWVRRLVETDKRFETAFLETYDRPISAVETEWLSKMNRWYRWLPIIGSSTLLWAMMSMMVVWGYFRKKRQAQAAATAEEMAESYLEQLNRRLAQPQPLDGHDDEPNDGGNGGGGPTTPPRVLH